LLNAQGRSHRFDLDPSIIAHWRILYTDAMFETRLATVADAELIARYRRTMFEEMGQADGEAMRAMIATFVPWVRERLKLVRMLAG
jgi:hypothetical protein